jgi:hypothetical protein
MTLNGYAVHFGLNDGGHRQETKYFLNAVPLIHHPGIDMSYQGGEASPFQFSLDLLPHGERDVSILGSDHTSLMQRPSINEVHFPLTAIWLSSKLCLKWPSLKNLMEGLHDLNLCEVFNVLLVLF